jgi:hypothetical protein
MSRALIIIGIDACMTANTKMTFRSKTSQKQSRDVLERGILYPPRPEL